MPRSSRELMLGQVHAYPVAPNVYPGSPLTPMLLLEKEKLKDFSFVLLSYLTLFFTLLSRYFTYRRSFLMSYFYNLYFSYLTLMPDFAWDD
jgi:hypothetical protein